MQNDNATWDRRRWIRAAGGALAATGAAGLVSGVPPPSGDDIANRLHAATLDFMAMLGRLGDINGRIAAQPPPNNDRPGILAPFGPIQPEGINVSALADGVPAEI